MYLNVPNPLKSLSWVFIMALPVLTVTHCWNKNQSLKALHSFLTSFFLYCLFLVDIYKSCVGMWPFLLSIENWADGNEAKTLRLLQGLVSHLMFFSLPSFRTFAASYEHSILVSSFLMAFEHKVWSIVNKEPYYYTSILYPYPVSWSSRCLLLKRLIFWASWDLFLSLLYWMLTSGINAFNLVEFWLPWERLS